MRSKIAYLISFFALTLFIFPSCNKDNIIDNANQVGSSRVTYYASFDMTGDAYMSIVVNQPYVEPGVAATQSGKPLTVTTTGAVDNTTPGIYTLTYSATNSDGFAASVTRTIAVLPAAETPGVDLSGTYYYVASAATTSTVTKLAPGFYSTTNCWSASTTIGCFFLCVDGMNITMPPQTTPYGQLFGTGTLAAGGALTYIVSIPSQGLNNVARNWHAQ